MKILSENSGHASEQASFAHAALTAAQEYRMLIERQELEGVVVFAIVGVVLVALAPAKQQVERVSAVSA